MDISVNTRKVKYTKDEEPTVTHIKVFNAPGYLKYFSAVKSYSTTWAQLTNTHAWQVKSTSIGLNSTTL